MKRKVYTRVARRANSILHRRHAKRGGKRTRRGGKGRKGKCLVGQRRNKAGRITRHGHYKKC